MKTNFFKTVTLILTTIVALSCSSDNSSSSSEIGGGSTTTSNTWVKLTATTGSVVKPNYIIMMFDEPVTTSAALPPIKKQVVTDANGLAFFDLNSIITTSTEKTYYFEAFVQNGSGYTWKSVSHYNVNLKKGTMATSSIIVN